jgi:hypothetical protein
VAQKNKREQEAKREEDLRREREKQEAEDATRVEREMRMMAVLVREAMLKRGTTPEFAEIIVQDFWNSTAYGSNWKWYNPQMIEIPEDQFREGWTRSHEDNHVPGVNRFFQRQTLTSYNPQWIFGISSLLATYFQEHPEVDIISVFIPGFDKEKNSGVIKTTSGSGMKSSSSSGKGKDKKGNCSVS